MAERTPSVEATIEGNTVTFQITTTTKTAATIYKRTMGLVRVKQVGEPCIFRDEHGMEEIHVSVEGLDAALGYLARLSDLEGLPLDGVTRRIKAFRDAEG